MLVEASVLRVLSVVGVVFVPMVTVVGVCVQSRCNLGELLHASRGEVEAFVETGSDGGREELLKLERPCVNATLSELDCTLAPHVVTPGHCGVFSDQLLYKITT